MNVTVTQNSRELEVEQNVRHKFALGLGDCKDIILPIAQALAPVRTGRYKRSMSYTVDEGKLEGMLAAGIYKPGDPNYSPHAHLIEWGTHKIAPRAPLRKAAEQARQPMGRVIAKRMEEPV